MTNRWIAPIIATLTVASSLAPSAVTTALAGDADWTPADWVEEETIELGTTEPGEDRYDFPVWLVVIDGDVYVRLGSKAAERFEESTTKPYMTVEIAEKTFPKVEGVPAPDQADQVDQLMADKYWSDVFIRFMPHPLTLRLEPR